VYFLIFFDQILDIAAVNSPGNVTLSGNATEIDEIVAAMKEKGVFAQVLRPSPPFPFPLTLTLSPSHSPSLPKVVYHNY
jgi:acyl transferase domain-containing protein